MGKGKSLIAFLFILPLIGGKVAAEEGFTRLLRLTVGAEGKIGRCFAADMDHDGYMEFGLCCRDAPPTFAGWQIWKCVSPDSFVMVKQASRAAGDTTNPGSLYPWTVGDVDGDGRTELVGYTNSDSPDYVGCVQTVESEDYFSYPTEINWMGAFEEEWAYFGAPFYLTDLDQDDKTDIIFFGMVNYVVIIYENVQNDSCRMVWTDTLTDKMGWHEQIVWGDFDDDGLIEFLTGNNDNDLIVWEHTGNDNAYQRVYDDKGGNWDMFGGEDMDGDSVPEFLTSGHLGVTTANLELWCYSAVNDNLYEGELIDTVTTVYMDDATSDVGDVDGDGLLEVVWSLGDRLMLLDDAQHDYARLGEWDDAEFYHTMLVTCADLTLDGRDEILVTGNFRTSVLSWGEVGVQEPSVIKPTPQWSILSPVGKTVTIRYANFPGGFHVSIFDASGRKVEEVRSCGSQGTFTWGLKHPPGVYFIVSGRNEATSRKVVLVR